MCKNTFQWILRFEEAGHWKRVFASILIVDVECPSPQSARHRRDENEQGKIKHLKCNRARSTGSHTARFPKLKVSPSSSPCAPGSLRVSAAFHRDFRHRTPRTVPGGDPSWIAPFATEAPFRHRPKPLPRLKNLAPPRGFASSQRLRRNQRRRRRITSDLRFRKLIRVGMRGPECVLGTPNLADLGKACL